MTGKPLEGAKFNVTYSSNDTDTGEINDLGTFYTDENGQFTLTRLRDGWYKVEELASVPGYQPPDGNAVQTLYVGGGSNAVMTFENVPLSAITVYKYDTVTGEAVRDAVFEIRYLTDTSGTGGTAIGRYKTGANGSFTVTGLIRGTYIVEELASDNGHVIDSAPQTAFLSGEDQDVVQLYFGNTPKGSLLVKKVSTANGEPLADTEFLVTTKEGTLVGTANGKFKTASDGTFLIENMEPGTTLVIKETRAKQGYLLDDTAQVATIQAGKTVELEFRNKPLGNLIIRKLDGSDRKTPLEGVRFKIIYADGSFVDADGGKRSSDGLYATDKNGLITLSGIVGTIVATEVSSIDGYTIDEATQTQTVVVNPDDTQTLTFYNYPIGGVELIKVNADNRAVRIPNTTFEIRKLDGALVSTVTTDANGRAFASLEDGGYYAVETVAAKNYKLDSTPNYFEVKGGKTTVLTVANKPMCGIEIHKTDAVTGDGIYGVSFLLYDSKNNVVGQYTSDDRGYVRIEEIDAGTYRLRELENPGYIVDTQLKTVVVKSGEVTLVDWKNTPITGQIQITKTSADYNSMNGWPEGTPIPNTVFEVYNRAGKLVHTIKTDKNGVAATKPLPLGRYKLVESKAADFYALDKTPIEVEIGFAGQIVRAAMTNKSLYTNVSITKRGYVEVMPGQSIRYDFSNIANNSNTALESFYWRDTLPTNAVRLDKIVTGTWNARGNYKIVYKTNYSGEEYRVLADNLATNKNYVLNASPAALGLGSGEYVTEFMAVFGVVPANFRQVEAPQVYCTVLDTLVGGAEFCNTADVGGLYNGQWIMAVDRWVTRVYKPAKPLPRTGY